MFSLQCCSKRDENVARGPTSPLIGFDFDCTLTTIHFYKVFGWGYTKGNWDEASKARHFGPFATWCKKHQIDPAPGRDKIGAAEVSAALDHFCNVAGDQAFYSMFREVFLGGEERINHITDWLTNTHDAGVQFAIITAGRSIAVLRALRAVPEWLPFFPSNRIWDTQQGRHVAPSTTAQKVLMLRDVYPDARRIILVDDSLHNDVPPDWVLQGASANIFCKDLPYEGPGINPEILDDIGRMVFDPNVEPVPCVTSPPVSER